MKVLSYIGLTVLFFGCSFIYGWFIFPGLISILEKLFPIVFHWEELPFLRGFFKSGIAIILSWIITKGTRNIFMKLPFSEGLNWKKLFIIVFCVALFDTLSVEFEKIIPGFATRESDYDTIEFGGGFLSTLKFFIIVLVIVIGKLMWPKQEYWFCKKCNSLNPWEYCRCKNSKCKSLRSGGKLSEKEVEKIRSKENI